MLHIEVQYLREPPLPVLGHCAHTHLAGGEVSGTQVLSAVYLVNYCWLQAVEGVGGVAGEVPGAVAE